jgi:hypothetical protein
MGNGYIQVRPPEPIYTLCVVVSILYPLPSLFLTFLFSMGMYYYYLEKRFRDRGLFGDNYYPYQPDVRFGLTTRPKPANLLVFCQRKAKGKLNT